MFAERWKGVSIYPSVNLLHVPEKKRKEKVPIPHITPSTMRPLRFRYAVVACSWSSHLQAATFRVCIRAAHITAWLAPITPRVWTWHDMLKKKQMSWLAVPPQAVWLAQHLAGRLDFTDRLTACGSVSTADEFSFGLLTFLRVSVCVFLFFVFSWMLTQQGKGWTATPLPGEINQSAARCFPANIKEAIGLADGSSWSPRCLRRACWGGATSRCSFWSQSQ